MHLQISAGSMTNLAPIIGWCKRRRTHLRQDLRLIDAGQLRMKRKSRQGWRDTTFQWAVETKRQITKLERIIEDLEKQNRRKHLHRQARTSRSARGADSRGVENSTVRAAPSSPQVSAGERAEDTSRPCSYCSSFA